LPYLRTTAEVENALKMRIMEVGFHSFGPHSFNPKYVWKYYGHFRLGSERGSANSGDSGAQIRGNSGEKSGDSIRNALNSPDK